MDKPRPLFPVCWAAMTRLSLFSVTLALLVPAPGFAQSKDESKGSSLGDLLNRVKDLKVPDSVSNLPKQLTELKSAYLETAKTVEELRLEVSALREEVEALKAENGELRDAVGIKVAANRRSDLLQPEEISAEELAKAYRADRAEADKRFRRRYLRVVGMIEGFETGTQEVIILLQTESDTKIRCHVKRDTNFHAEVAPDRKGLISRNDRSTLLSVGQPVTMIGTCMGMNLDIMLANSRVDGLDAKRAE